MCVYGRGVQVTAASIYILSRFALSQLTELDKQWTCELQRRPSAAWTCLSLSLFRKARERNARASTYTFMNYISCEMESLCGFANDCREAADAAAMGNRKTLALLFYVDLRARYIYSLYALRLLICFSLPVYIYVYLIQKQRI